jgi:hypothetical protein
LGFCSLGTSIPADSAQSSYILSQYEVIEANGYSNLVEASHCNSTEVSAFSVYPTNLCYATTNYTSLLYSCSDSSSSSFVTMYQFYDSTLCSNSTEFGESIISIPQTCSATNNFSVEYGKTLFLL